MRTGWLIYRQKDAKENEGYINWFIEEAQKENIRLQLILREELTIGITEQQRTVLRNNRPVPLPDFAVVRTIEPILNAQLESLGIAVFNSSEVAKICNDKAWTHHYVQKLGVPMTDTYFYTKADLTRSEAPLAYPFVMKQAGGRSGEQVYFIADETDWTAALKKLATDTIILQSTNVQLGKDIRVFVIGKEIIGAVLRHNDQDFRANFKLGGSASLYDLSVAEKKLIYRIIDRFSFGLVGIDFLIAPNGGLLFNEIEDVVGSRTLSAVSDINILEKYVKFIKEKLI